MPDVAIGIDVGGTKALALLVARDGRVLGEAQAHTPHVDTPDAGRATSEALVALIQSLCSLHGLDARTTPIGVGLPGLMRRDGRLAYAPNLQSANGADLGTLLGSQLGNVSVFADNDANCAALCEHEWGAAHGVDDFVMITLGTGIGGGIFIDGALARGRSGFAGEIGHMVVLANGAPCPCSAKGCWERYASGGGLQRIVKEAQGEGRLPVLSEMFGNALRGEDVTAAAGDGLDEAVNLIDGVGWWLALGIANLVAILDTGTFVIGGGLGSATPQLLRAARNYLPGLTEGAQYRSQISVSESAFGARSGAMGAALLAFGE